MSLWLAWYRCVHSLREACSRQSTFVWMCIALAGFCLRTDLAGVSSWVRALDLHAKGYPGCCICVIPRPSMWKA